MAILLNGTSSEYSYMNIDGHSVFNKFVLNSAKALFLFDFEFAYYYFEPSVLICDA